ncbi:MAG: hypothetical protein ACLGPL_07540 [Acidobacteriota bacterium]
MTQRSVYSCGRLIVAMVLLVLLTACGTLRLSPVGGTVPQDKWIPLQQGAVRGAQWEGRELSVKYDYTRNGDELKMSGEAFYADLVTYNFSFIEYLRLDVLLLDQSGSVLAMKGLTSRSMAQFHYPNTFSVSMTLPPGTAYMAFSYRMQARESDNEGGGSPSYFWEYPVR